MIFKTILLGAKHGLAAWTIYWLAECCFSSVLPRVLGNNLVFVASHGRVSLLLLLSYMGIGLITGGMMGAALGVARETGFRPCRATEPDQILRSAATLTLLLGFSAILVAWFRHESFAQTMLAVLLILGGAAALSGLSAYWFRKLSFLTNPWALSFALTGAPWIREQGLAGDGIAGRNLAAAGYFAGVLAFAWLISRLTGTPHLAARKQAPRSTGGNPLVPASMAVVALAFLFLWDRFPRPSLPQTSSNVQGKHHPNVVLVTLDTVRADHLSVLGYHRDTTPRLRQFAQHASLYLRASAAAEQTLASHASIFTGQYPNRHGAYCDLRAGHPFGRPLSESAQTLAEQLADRGYVTLAIVANHAYLGRYFQLDQGFQYYADRAPVLMLDNERHYFIRQAVRNLLARFTTTDSFDVCYRDAGEMNREALLLLRELRRDGRPFFLFLNYMDAHAPYIPPAPFNRLYPGKATKGFTYESFERTCRAVLRLERPITATERNHYVSQYDGAIAYLDHSLGELFATLQALGLYDNTLVVITSDHGESFGEKNLIEHGTGKVYQDQVHVPLIVKYPGSQAKAVVTDLVSHVDIAPTVLEVTGAEMPSDLQGWSLRRLPATAARSVLSEGYPPADIQNMHPRFRRIWRALFFDSWKLISSDTGDRELFDLTADQNENRDLNQSEIERVRQLSAKLNELLKSSRSDFDRRAKPARDTLQRLRSLSYVR